MKQCRTVMRSTEQWANQIQVLIWKGGHGQADQRDKGKTLQQKKVWKFSKVLDPPVDYTIDAHGIFLDQLYGDEFDDRPLQNMESDWQIAGGRSISKKQFTSPQ
ncbi:hypothetical protein HAX54_008093 [Datura stramonium]|uniref:Uncharacterized protein n=1 Tax=Datura stramonium TaxID=4076 RepID=A0ABS8TCQ0_DATST|nr:hypothetical protein [Datura stramonium]